MSADTHAPLGHPRDLPLLLSYGLPSVTPRFRMGRDYSRTEIPTCRHVRSRVPRHIPVLEHVHHALRDIDERRGGGLRDLQMCDQPARGAARRTGDGVTLQTAVPFGHARGDGFIAL